MKLSVFTFGSTRPSSFETKIVEIGIKLMNGETYKIRANKIPKITGDLEVQPVDLKGVNLNDFELADTLPTEPGFLTVDLLIGNDYYDDLILSEKKEVTPGLYLLGSQLGWLVSGRIVTSNPFPHKSSSLSLTLLDNHSEQIYTCNPIEQSDTAEITQFPPNLEEFWRLETIGIKESYIGTEDNKANENFNRTVTVNENRYEVTWPWRDENPDLPENYHLALRRPKSSVQTLLRKSKILEEYNNIIEMQCNQNIVEKVGTRSEVGALVHYIPHHAIIKSTATTTKLRIVYDASAKANRMSPSLNDCQTEDQC